MVIRNVRVFDGEKIIGANSIAVADGKILAVGTNVASPPNAQVRALMNAMRGGEAVARDLPLAVGALPENE